MSLKRKRQPTRNKEAAKRKYQTPRIKRHGRLEFISSLAGTV